MKKRLWFFVFVIGLMMLAVTLLSGCSQDKSAPELVARAEAQDPEAGVPDGTESDTADSGQAVASVQFTDQACLTCHTNQDILKAMAVEEEDAGESLSSGPG